MGEFKVCSVCVQLRQFQRTGDALVCVVLEPVSLEPRYDAPYCRLPPHGDLSAEISDIFCLLLLLVCVCVCVVCVSCCPPPPPRLPCGTCCCCCAAIHQFAIAFFTRTTRREMRRIGRNFFQLLQFLVFLSLSRSRSVLSTVPKLKRKSQLRFLHILLFCLICLFVCLPETQPNTLCPPAQRPRAQQPNVTHEFSKILVNSTEIRHDQSIPCRRSG